MTETESIPVLDNANLEGIGLASVSPRINNLLEDEKSILVLSKVLVPKSSKTNGDSRKRKCKKRNY